MGQCGIPISEAPQLMGEGPGTEAALCGGEEYVVEEDVCTSCNDFIMFLPLMLDSQNCTSRYIFGCPKGYRSCMPEDDKHV